MCCLLGQHEAAYTVCICMAPGHACMAHGGRQHSGQLLHDCIKLSLRWHGASNRLCLRLTTSVSPFRCPAVLLHCNSASLSQIRSRDLRAALVNRRAPPLIPCDYSCCCRKPTCCRQTPQRGHAIKLDHWLRVGNFVRRLDSWRCNHLVAGFATLPTFVRATQYIAEPFTRPFRSYGGRA